MEDTDDELIKQFEEMSKKRHKNILGILSIFPESKYPITLIGTIAVAYGLNVKYTQDEKTIIISKE